MVTCGFPWDRNHFVYTRNEVSFLCEAVFVWNLLPNLRKILDLCGAWQHGSYKQLPFLSPFTLVSWTFHMTSGLIMNVLKSSNCFIITQSQLFDFYIFKNKISQINIAFLFLSTKFLLPISSKWWIVSLLFLGYMVWIMECIWAMLHKSVQKKKNHFCRQFVQWIIMF